VACEKEMKSFLLLLILFYSCSKRSGINNSPGRADLLVNKKWKISAISVKLPNGVTYPDNYTTLPSYKKDDYFYFNADLTFSDNDNVERSPNDSTGILDSGSWQLANGENDLQMVTTLFQTGTAIDYYPTKILELTNTIMYWESTSPYDGTIVWTTYIAIQ
jgi:hypothetical protein